MNSAPTADRVASESNHVPVLDGIRGLAILLVMWSHFYGLGFGLAGRQPTLAIDSFVRRVFATGWVGVDLFFVLSGFLITGILYDAKNSPFFFRNFYARRFLRIFPLYYGFLLVVLFVVPHISPVSTFAHVDQLRNGQFYYWTYLVNLWYGIKPLSGDGSIIHSHFWSLAVEEQFYIVWPAVVLAFSRRQLMWFCAALVVAAFAIRVVLTNDVSSGFAKLDAAHVLMPARMDTLALGAILALAARSPGELAAFARWGGAVAATCGAIVVVLFFRQHGLSTLDPDVLTVGLSAFALLFAAVLALTITSPPGGVLQRVFASPILRFFGRYAYGLYVVHVLIAFELAPRFISRGWMRPAFGSQIPMNIIFGVFGIGVSVAIAFVSWHLFEKQFLKLKRFVPYDAHRLPRAAATPPPPRETILPPDAATAQTP